MADVKTTEKAPELSMGFDHSHTDDHDNDIDRDEQQPQVGKLKVLLYLRINLQNYDNWRNGCDSII